MKFFCFILSVLVFASCASPVKITEFSRNKHHYYLYQNRHGIAVEHDLECPECFPEYEDSIK